MEKPEGRECLRDLFVTGPFEDKHSPNRERKEDVMPAWKWILGTEDTLPGLLLVQTNVPQDRNTRVLWLHGNPRTGKSILAIFIVAERSIALDVQTLAYLFCDSAFDDRRTTTSTVRGLPSPTRPVASAASRSPAAEVQRAWSGSVRGIRRSSEEINAAPQSSEDLDEQGGGGQGHFVVFSLDDNPKVEHSKMADSLT
ncbi:hypothetical protein BR93DRAFT_972350 [Coniochaeta sp. PMI_546]|nr:hypothetical protein BR93DRAFT_972350 [Coniochaeta sp. PMI_546]